MQPRSAFAVFMTFLRLGLTSFGGPVAHIGYFRAEFVERRAWVSDHFFADLVALCQFLPGPASSQVGIGLGYAVAGYRGAVAAWVGFTLPSALIMLGCGLGAAWFDPESYSSLLHGLKVVAVAVVAQAVWGMGRTLCPEPIRATFAAGSAVLALLLPTTWGQLGAIAAGAVGGWWLLTPKESSPAAPMAVAMPRSHGIIWLALLGGALVGLPLAATWSGNPWWEIGSSFFWAGSLIFGGGHVILPLLQQEVVATGWLDQHLFLAGYGAAQAIPGPLSTFATFLGATMTHGPGGASGGLLALVAIFLPSFLLVLGALPFWDGLRTRRAVQAMLMGVNAAVVGLLLAALYHPVWSSSILAPGDFALAVAAFTLLVWWRVPPWLVVVLTGTAGAALGG